MRSCVKPVFTLKQKHEEESESEAAANHRRILCKLHSAHRACYLSMCAFKSNLVYYLLVFRRAMNTYCNSKHMDRMTLRSVSAQDPSSTTDMIWFLFLLLILVFVGFSIGLHYAQRVTYIMNK
jgi:hypothetical protein